MDMYRIFTFFVLSPYPIRTMFGIASLVAWPYGTKMERRKYVQMVS